MQCISTTCVWKQRTLVLQQWKIVPMATGCLERGYAIDKYFAHIQERLLQHDLIHWFGRHLICRVNVNVNAVMNVVVTMKLKQNGEPIGKGGGLTCDSFVLYAA